MIQIRMSAIGGCVRGLVYQALGYPVKQMASSKTRRMWAMGHLLEHMVFQESIGVSEALSREISLTFEYRGETIGRLVGHPDHEEPAVNGGPKIIYECKSMHPFPFSKAKKDGIAVHYPQYLMQLACYVVASGADQGQFICVDRGGGAEFVEIWTFGGLLPYFQAVAYRTWAIYHLTKKGVLPMRSPRLPKWACSPEYCVCSECKHLKGNKNG